MLVTNRQFQTLIRQLDSQIARLERAVLHSGETRAAPLLEELWVRRRSLRLVLLNRRVEAARRVVDFGRWRDGNGAIYLCKPPEAGSRHSKAQ